MTSWPDSSQDCITTNDLQDTIEDHALERVPDHARESWLKISWNTAGVVTTLVILFFGALVSFVAGFRIALLAGVFVTLVGGLLGCLTGQVAYRTGLSNTVIARKHGFGVKGSIVASAVYAFMIIGFLALENALLYKGSLFYFRLEDTLANAALIYGLFTVVWIALTTWGFKLVTRVASISMVGFLAVLVYMTWLVVSRAGLSFGEITSFPAQLPSAGLAALGADTDLGKFVFAVNVLIGSAGALSLTVADLCRYARSTRDVVISALVGNFALGILMLALGGIVMYAGMPSLVDHYVAVSKLAPEAARRLALESPDSVAAAFVVFGGILGTILMFLAQGKAQVLNTYSASLALSNLCDAAGHWRPGRFWFVVLANLIGLLMLQGQILHLVREWVTLLGVLTTCVAGIIVCDYYLLGRIAISRHRMKSEAVNWAGVVTVLVSTVLAHYIVSHWIRIEFFTSLGTTLLLYPSLRLTLFRFH